MNRSPFRLALLGLAFLAAARPGRAADVEKLLPAETDAVVSVNVRQLLDSELVKQYALDFIKAALGKSQEARKLFTAMGLDPLKDFSRITIGGGGEDANDSKAVIVVEGTFDPARINATASQLAKQKGENISTETVAGKTAFKLTGDKQPTPLFAAVLDKNLLVAATSKELLTGAIEGAEGKRRPELKKDVVTLFGKADPRSSLFMVATLKGKLEKLPVPDPMMKKLLEEVESLTADVRVESDVKLTVAVGTGDEETARELNAEVEKGLEQAKQIVPLLAIQNPDLAPLGDAVKNITSAAKGKSVVIKVGLPADAIARIVKAGKGKE